ncbi:hypothetical protein ACTWPT_42070 [Nonomuraea sp. 3N208]|uniref:hypothetical protein n=1 Tax=Nonomuraea sp. 3N208 TaxID=3457421 RepID=UPI003FD0EAAC
MLKSKRIACILAAGSIASVAAGAYPASAAGVTDSSLAPASVAAASNCTTYVAGGPSAAPGQPPKKVYAHARSTCDYVYGVKLEMTLYRDGVKVGQKKICQEGPINPEGAPPQDMICEVNLRVKNPSGIQTWKVKVKAQWINGFRDTVTKSYTESFTA